jgi:hypothetical protein
MPQSSIILTSDRLTVEVALPETAYKGTRFDWTGFITQVTLDGAHTFCVPESLEPGQGTGGIGLCNEFGIERPIGYDDAAPGELFPKLGIGVLVRPDEGPYRFMVQHEIAERFPIHIEAAPDQVRFVVDPVPCRGVAARLTKTLAVSGSELTIDYQLENAGKKPIATHEYVHNFCGIDGHEIGPDYRLRFAQPVVLEDTLAQIRKQMEDNRDRLPPEIRDLTPEQLQQRMLAIYNIDGHDLSLHATPERPFYCRLTGLVQTDGPQWELTHLPTGLQAREYDSFSPSRIAVWGVAHVISAEVFVDVDVEPGETQTWKRRYVFE